MKAEQLGNITLYNADCLEIMKTFKDKQFNLAIIDPPYGLDIANMNMGVGKSKKASRVENRKWKPNGWDKETPSKDFFDELFRVSENQIIWGGNYFELPKFDHFVVWDKEIDEQLSFSQCELAWTSFKCANKIFRYSVYKDKKYRFHPTQKPIQLYKWLLQNYAKQGDKILDTHFGSLSIGIACHDMGFELTAIELDKDYYEAGKERLRNHQRQLTIF